MTSTRGGAGIKILVHDPNEFPLVGDLGQAVGTGTHAFIPVHMVKVSIVDNKTIHTKPHTRPSFIISSKPKLTFLLALYILNSNIIIIIKIVDLNYFSHGESFVCFTFVLLVLLR